MSEGSIEAFSATLKVCMEIQVAQADYSASVWRDYARVATWRLRFYDSEWASTTDQKEKTMATIAHEWKAGDVIDWYGDRWMLWDYDHAKATWAAFRADRPRVSRYRARFTAEMLTRATLVPRALPLATDDGLPASCMHCGRAREGCTTWLYWCWPCHEARGISDAEFNRDMDAWEKRVVSGPPVERTERNRGFALMMEDGPGIAALSLSPARERWVCSVTDEDCLGVDVP